MADDSSAVPTVSGTTTLTDSQDFEVTLLAIQAALLIADRIASDVDTAIGAATLAGTAAETKATVILGDGSLLADLADWRAVSARLDMLDEAIRRAVSAGSPGDTETLAEDHAAGHAEDPLLALATLDTGLAAISKVMSYFNADTSYFGRTVTLDDATLLPALAGALTADGCKFVEEVRIGSAASAANPAAGDALDLNGRLSRLEQRCRDLENLLPPATDGGEAQPAAGADAGGPEAGTDPSPDAAPVPDPRLTRLRALLSTGNQVLVAFLGQTSKQAAAMQAASRLARVIDAAPAACLLDAKYIKAGGHYRIKQTLLTRLFAGDQMSYTGGAAITYVLTDLKSGKVICGDVLYHSSGEVRFPTNQSVQNSSNLTSASLPERTAKGLS